MDSSPAIRSFRFPVSARAGFIALCALFAAVWSGMPQGSFYSPDEGAKYLQMRGTGGNPLRPCRLFYGGIDRDPEMFYYPARVESTLYSLYPYRDAEGKVQTNWMPWFPYATKPFHALLGSRGLYVLPLLAGLLALALTGRLAGVLEPGARGMALAAFALSSPLLFYSLTFWEHTLALALQLGALLAVLPGRAESGDRKGVRIGRLVVAVFLLLGATALRRETVFFIAALGVALFLLHDPDRIRRFAGPRIRLLVVAIAATILLVALLPWLLPGRTDIDLLLTLYRAVHVDTWRYIGTHFFNVFFLWDEEGVLPAAIWRAGQAGFLVCMANALWPRARRPWAFVAGLVLVLPAASYLAFTPFRYRALHSLALCSPFVLLSLLPWPAPGRRSAAERLVRNVALFYAVFYLFGTLPSHRGHGGLEWGSRYALALFSLLSALGAVQTFRWWKGSGAGVRKKFLPAALVFAVFLIGSSSLVRGVRELSRTRRDLGCIEAALRATPGTIVTDWGWLASALTDFYMGRVVYTVDSVAELHGWLEGAGKDEASFVYASYEPMPEMALRREKGRIRLASSATVCGLGISVYRRTAAAP